MKTIERLINLKLFRISMGYNHPVAVHCGVGLYFHRTAGKSIHQFLLESAAHASHSVDRAIGEQIGILNGLAASRSLDHADFDSFRETAQRLIQVHPEWRTVIVIDEKSRFSICGFRRDKISHPCVILNH